MMGPDMPLFFMTEDRSITRKIFQLFEGNNDDLLGSVNFQDFHVIADRMTKSITDIGVPRYRSKHHFEPNTALWTSFLLLALHSTSPDRFSATCLAVNDPLPFASLAGVR